MLKSIYRFVFLIPLLLLGCIESTAPNFPQGDVVGYQPVYLTDSDNEISLVGARAVEDPGQIYLLGDLLLMNDVGKGIHVIDNSDPTAPVNSGFLKVLGSENMVLKDGIVYVNQFNSLLAIDMTDADNIQVISRDEGALKTNDSDSFTPPLTGYFFECVDSSKGTVIGWRLTTITNPKCYK